MAKSLVETFARVGAKARLKELEAEIAAIRAQFPDVDSAMTSVPFQRTPRRRFSAATRSKMAAAQKARWAKLKKR